MGDINIAPQQIGQSVPEAGGTMIGNLKNLKAGAGQPIKATTEGFFIGSETFSSAPFRVTYDGSVTIGNPNKSTTSISSSDGSLILSYDNTKYGSIAVDSFTNFIMTTTNNFQFFDSLSNQLAVLDYTNGLQINGNGGPKLKGESFELQLDKQMRFNGRIYPITNATSGLDCGDPSKKWNYIYAKNNGIGDLVIFDKYCPICEQKLDVGEALVFYTYKTEEEIHDGLHSVPIHFGCADKIKTKTQKDIKNFIDLKAKEQKEYEDKKEKEFDEKMKLKKYDTQIH